MNRHIPARNRPGQVRRIMLQLEHSPSGSGTDLGAAMKGIHELVRKRCMIFLFSDLLAPVEELEKQIGYLSAAGHDLVIFQFLDHREIHFDFDKATHFRDTETGKDLYVDPANARKRYLEKFEAHQEAVRTMCARHRANYRLVSTSEPLDRVMFDFVQDRQQGR